MEKIDQFIPRFHHTFFIRYLSFTIFSLIFMLFILSFTIFSLILILFTSATYAAEVTLAWDPNTEANIAGYKIYYKSGSSGAPYDGTGADQGPSGMAVPNEDLDDPDNPKYTLTVIDDGETYYFAATAYNYDELESDYSNEAVHETSPVNTAPSVLITAPLDNG